MVWLLAILLAAPPLTESQRVLLDEPGDPGRVDEPALYGLLPNAAAWEGGDEAGAAIANYTALYDDPAAHRGELFLIEGRFAGRSRRIGLQRPGAWGEALTEWVLLTGDGPDEVAVVFFVDPDNELPTPATGQRVRTVGRFYKVWSDTDAHGEPTDYPVFVARYPTLVDAHARGDGAAIPVMLIVIVLLLVVGIGVLLVLRRAAVRPVKPRRTRDAEDTAEQLESHLPVDPADALAELERRGGRTYDDPEAPS